MSMSKIRQWLPFACVVLGGVFAWGAVRQEVAQSTRDNDRQQAWIDEHTEWGNEKYAEIMAALGEIRADVRAILRELDKRHSSAEALHGPPADAGL